MKYDKTLDHSSVSSQWGVFETHDEFVVVVNENNLLQ
jgi:hypothetical protein